MAIWSGAWAARIYNLSMASARPKYHIFGHVHEEGLKRKAMLGSTTYLNVSYFEELRKAIALHH